MRIVVFFVISLIAHVIFLGGMVSFKKYYLIPKQERDKLEQKKKDEAKTQAEEKKKKMEQKGTAQVVGPKEAKQPEGGQTPAPPKDLTKPNPDNVKPFDEKDKKPLPSPSLDNMNDEFDLKNP